MKILNFLALLVTSPYPPSGGVIRGQVNKVSKRVRVIKGLGINKNTHD